MSKDKKPAISTRECNDFRGLVGMILAIANEIKRKPAYVIKKALWNFCINWKKGDKL